MGIYEELQARGLIAQVTDEAEIRDLINRGGAPAADFLHLMEHVQDTVEALSGVRLEPEVRIVGSEG